MRSTQKADDVTRLTSSIPLQALRHTVTVRCSECQQTLLILIIAPFGTRRCSALYKDKLLHCSASLRHTCLPIETQHVLSQASRCPAHALQFFKVTFSDIPLTAYLRADRFSHLGCTSPAVWLPDTATSRQRAILLFERFRAVRQFSCGRAHM